jgi:4-hydroxy-2-oxoglutarate aldolase
MNTEAFVRHYTAVADACPAPVLLYNFPAAFGVDLPLPAISRLAAHPNIAGVKESGGDVARIADVAAAASMRSDFAIYCGSAPVLYSSLLGGATGGILALACVVPELCVELYKLTTAGRHAEAGALQRRLTPLARLVTSTYGVPGLKAALDLVGYAGGEPRAPLAPAPADAVTAIRGELAALGALVEP